MPRPVLTAICVLTGLLLHSSAFQAQTTQQQLPANAGQQHHLTPFSNPTLPPGAVELIKLEGDFEKAVEKGGGKAFASWFAEDGITLNNGQPAVQGQRAIAAHANWDPKDYQLTWYPEGAQLGPSGDTGFTWGHYEAHFKSSNGQPGNASGRYITFWKKVNGAWKVALDASATDAPPATSQP